MTEATWRPSEDLLVGMARTHCNDLLNLIASGILDDASLTFAAEALCCAESSDRVGARLLKLLEHENAVVREGAIYGCSDEHVAHTPRIREVIEKMAKEDPSLHVRVPAIHWLKEETDDDQD